MKANFWRMIIAVCLVFASLGGVASAAGRVDRPDRLSDLSSLPLPERPTVYLGEEGPGVRRISGEAITARQKPDAALVQTGAPGLSYRYEDTIGVTFQPYISDTQHLNVPFGIAVDASYNVFVVENEGSRLIKYNSAGATQFVVGKAGVQLWSEDYPQYMSWPTDVQVGSGGNLWVAMNGVGVVKYNNSGQYQEMFPNWPDDLWDCVYDNDHFCEARGLALDSSNHLYVADSANQRVQVFDISSGSMVYSTTITASPNPMLYPYFLDVDASGNLYVSDYEAHVVWKCSHAPAWSCSIFHGSYNNPGDQAWQLSWPSGVAVDGSSIYLADEGNWRIKKCTNAGLCNNFIASGIEAPEDIETDAAHNLYVTVAWNQFTIEKYNSAGAYLGKFAGTKNVPYLTNEPPNSPLLQFPNGLAWDSSGNLYASEEYGHRVVKIDKDKKLVWTQGIPGVSRTNTFGSLRGNLALSTTGKLYVPDSSRHRIKVLNTNDGSLSVIIGVTNTPGSTNDKFNDPRGVAISPLNGDIYVADRNNNRVQIFTSSHQYKDTLNAADTGGDFYHPTGVAVDNTGNVYVADQDRHRVQKFNSSLVHQYTIGVTDQCDWPYGYLCGPHSVAVDSSGRVFIVEQYNHRVTVYDSSGKYLATVVVDWGWNWYTVRNPVGIALDAAGRVYVSDRNNHRIQVFAPGYPMWVQRNINGFGNPITVVWSLEVLNNQLYAGTFNDWDDMARVYRSNDAKSWTDFTPAWPGDTEVVMDLQQFGNYLYAGTYPARLWRTDGTNWENVSSDFANDPNNYAVGCMGVFSGTLFLGTSNWETGIEIWSSPDGNQGNWTQVNADGFGNKYTSQDCVLQVFGDEFFVGTTRWDDTAQRQYAELWKTDNSLSWTPVFTDGLGVDNQNTASMAVLDGKLYIGFRNPTAGGSLYRSSDGMNFDLVFNGGLGDANNQRLYGLYVFDGYLYAVFSNLVDGGEVWRSPDGDHWELLAEKGFGHGWNRFIVYFNKNITDFKGSLYLGSMNWVSGGQIWQYLSVKSYLPLVTK